MALSFFQKLQQRNRDFTVEIDGQTLLVQVVQNDRAKRLTLRLKPGGGGLKVSTPGHIGDDEIEAFVARNKNWAAARLSRLPEQIEIEEGATVPFRGEDHIVSLTRKMRGVVKTVERDGYKFIEVPGDETTASRKLLSFLKTQARKELDRVVFGHAKTLGVQPKRLRITDTTSRWGSCSSTRTLSFTWRIIMAPPEVLNYLAAHEVAHLREMNHSKAFWDLTRMLCPDMETHKAWLRQNGAKLHAVKL